MFNNENKTSLPTNSKTPIYFLCWKKKNQYFPKSQSLLCFSIIIAPERKKKKHKQNNKQTTHNVKKQFSIFQPSFYCYVQIKNYKKDTEMIENTHVDQVFLL